MVSIQDIQSVDPYEFEEIVAELWDKKGYETNVRKKSGDRGIDIEAKRGGIKEVIQVKRYTGENKIGSNQIRKYATLYQQTDANQVIIVTSGKVTSEARSLAEDLRVEIINGFDLAQQLEEYSIKVDRDTTTNTNNTTASGSKQVRSTSSKPSDDLSAEKSLIKSITVHVLGLVLFVFVLATIQVVIGGISTDELVRMWFLFAGLFTVGAALDGDSWRIGTWLLGLFYLLVTAFGG